MSVCLYVSLSIYMPIYLSRICNNQYMSSRIGSPARASCPACPLSYQDCHKETLSESETYKSKLRSTKSLVKPKSQYYSFLFKYHILHSKGRRKCYICIIIFRLKLIQKFSALQKIHIY